MNIREILRVVFINIKENKFRVFLTALGIIVGSLTIVLVLAIGEGTQAEIAEQYKSLNAGTIMIMPAFGGKAPPSVTLEDVQDIKDNCPSLKKITIILNGNANVNYYNISQSASIMGVTTDYKEINNLELSQGDFFTDEDNDDLARVAVIGSELVELFFNNDLTQAVDNTIIINGKRFSVVGILKETGDTQTDESILVPYSVSQKFISGRFARARVTALANDIDQVPAAITEVNEALQKLYRDQSSNFMVRDAGERLEAAQASARTMTIMLLSVAVIVLIVGGIGIMNVLFVTVQERTKEIGILKAIGARKKDILLIFLFEAIIVSASGGIIGNLLYKCISPLMQYFQVNVITTYYAYLLSFLFSLGTGTFFGYYPAAKAARLKPIEALNYE